jgi:4-amino-4-deoxy-L-arabinose transferase-like glycosyltransferase
MLHAHSLLVTTYAGATEFWNLKPPLGYWLLELAYLVAGETPLALRLPAALCALATTALTMLMARRAAGTGAALLAGLVLTTSFGFLGHHGARSGELDAPLTLLLFLFVSLAPRLFDHRQARLAAGLVLALGFLLKSFAILPFVAAVVVYGLMTRGVASWRAWPLPAAITVATAATWAIARSVAEGSWEFARRMFVEDLFLRSTTMIDEGRAASVWDYVGGLADRLAPWPLLVLIAFFLCRGFARRRLAGDLGTLLGCYALVPLLLFTAARTHHFWYIIPTYPAWAILGAVATQELIERAERFSIAGPVTAAVLVLSLLAGEARIVTHATLHDRLPPSQVFLASLHDSPRAGSAVIRTAFTPSYSERFFLQVVDGFQLQELDSHELSLLSQASDKPSLLLIRRSGTESAPGAMDPVRTTLLAQSDDYTLVRWFPPLVKGHIANSDWVGTE